MDGDHPETKEHGDEWAGAIPYVPRWANHSYCSNFKFYFRTSEGEGAYTTERFLHNW